MIERSSIDRAEAWTRAHSIGCPSATAAATRLTSVPSCAMRHFLGEPCEGAVQSDPRAVRAATSGDRGELLWGVAQFDAPDDEASIGRFQAGERGMIARLRFAGDGALEWRRRLVRLALIEFSGAAVTRHSAMFVLDPVV